VDVFPAHQQDQIKVQLANSLEAVVAQQLVRQKVLDADQIGATLST